MNSPGTPQNVQTQPHGIITFRTHSTRSTADKVVHRCVIQLTLLCQTLVLRPSQPSTPFANPRVFVHAVPVWPSTLYNGTTKPKLHAKLLLRRALALEQLCTKMKYSGGIEEAKDTLDSALRLGYSAGVRTNGAHMD